MEALLNHCSATEHHEFINNSSRSNKSSGDHHHDILKIGRGGVPVPDKHKRGRRIRFYLLLIFLLTIMCFLNLNIILFVSWDIDHVVNENISSATMLEQSQNDEKVGQFIEKSKDVNTDLLLRVTRNKDTKEDVVDIPAKGGPVPGSTFQNRHSAKKQKAAVEEELMTKLQAAETSTKSNTHAQKQETSTFSEEDYEKVLLVESLKPWSNVTTGVFTNTNYAGLNNQIRSFLGFSIVAHEAGVDQIIENNIHWKDTFGTRNMVIHKKLWDVVHWNTFYPTLPRFASYDKDLHPDIDVRPQHRNIEGKEYIAPAKISFKRDVIPENYTIANPRKYAGRSTQGFARSRKIERQMAAGTAGEKQAKIHESILKGALRPHPFLQSIIDKEIARLTSGGKVMTVHLRVEPDMARQNRVCSDKKVYNVTEIIDAIHSKFPEPPVNTVLIQFSRDLIENEAKRRNAEGDDVYLLNQRNLKEINRILSEGMWGGKVKVAEAGTELVEDSGHPFYKHYSTISGGIVNLFLGIQSDIFVGTEVSTYSIQVINSRFYRNSQESYFYRPDGLHALATSLKKPHIFGC